MNMDDFKEAQRVYERLQKWKDLRRDVSEREVNFVEGDRVHGLGRMQISETHNDELRDHMMAAAMWWFDDKIASCYEELQKLGVDIPDGEAVKVHQLRMGS